MNGMFRAHVESLHPSFVRLIAMPPIKACALPMEMPVRGIYLFSEGDKHLYVGRTNRLRRRLTEHCRKGSAHNNAPFAFLLARVASGKTAVSYRPKGSRAEFEKDTTFMSAFATAKSLVSNMDIRYVEEIDPLRQALLEMYMAISLQTPHNSFENH